MEFLMCIFALKNAMYGGGAGGGEAHGGGAGTFRQGVGLAGLGAQAMGTVAGADCGDAQPLHCLGEPVVLTGGESGFFF